jgi:hypothetical protein
MPINITTGSAAAKSYKSSGGGGLYPFTTVTFNVTGSGQYSGASSTAVAQSYMTGGELGGWMYNSSFFYISGGYYYWMVPKTGDYRMVTQGPRGYSPQGYGGSNGTYMSGNFSLTSGQWLKMLIGQLSGGSYGGGSGMTAIATDTNTPLLVSGGGTGGSPWNPGTYYDARTDTSGAPGSYPGGSSGYGAYGNGGYGGAGFYGNGSGNSPSYTSPPISFVGGGQGGTTCNAAGGFGGGAGVDGCYFGSGAGAGGYSGGGGGNPYAGGGGSYNAGSSQSNYVSYGSGYITITKL